MDLLARVERYFSRQSAWLEEYAASLAALAEARDESAVAAFLDGQARRDAELAGFAIEQRGLLHEWSRAALSEESRAAVRARAAAAAILSEQIEARLAAIIAQLESAKQTPEDLLLELRRARAAFGKYHMTEEEPGGAVDELA